MLLDAAFVQPHFPPPRPFQVTAREALRAGVRAGHRCQMVCSPTGSGKTMLAMYLISEALARRKRAIFVADRITLIDQTSMTADELGLPHGVIQANHPRTDCDQLFQVASAQTLGRRNWPKADLIIIDEAHTQLKAWTEHIARVESVVVGLSATPFSAGLRRHFSNLVNATTMAELVAQGTLVPMRVFAARRIDMRGAEVVAGEWSDAAAAERGIAIVGDVVREWTQHAYGRKSIAFGATIRHCEELCRQFSDAGIMAAVYCQDTPDRERVQLVREFRRPDSMLRVLISVEALAKGFDVPDVSCVIDCRPLRRSLSTYVQMVGRGLRASPITGKTDCIILDHSGNSVRFAEDFANLFYNGLDRLDDGEKLDKTVREDDDERATRACPSCGFSPFAKRCISCGFEQQTRPLVAHQDGELVEIVLGGKKLADDRRDLFNQLATYARTNSAPEKQLARARHLFRDIVGAPPPPEWTLANTPLVEPSAATRGKIKSMQIRYARGCAKAAAPLQKALTL